MTVVIIREDLLNQEAIFSPMLDYALQAKNNSLYNTPPTYAIYIAKLVFEWVKAQGGVAGITEKDQQKSQLLYDAIENPLCSRVQSKKRVVQSRTFHLLQAMKP